MNNSFNEWFHQLEGYHIKSERFYESLTAFSNEALAISTVKWLEAAFDAGRAAEREACAKVCEKLRDEDGYEAWNTECAAAIRARGEQK
jgi:hypothetical protein